MLNRLGLACALAAIGIGSASAASVTFTLAAGTTVPDSGVNLPVNASATVTTMDGGGITVILNDLQASPLSAAQLLSDFTFTLGNSFTGLGSTITPTGVTLIDISSTGVRTVNSTTAVATWGLSTTAGNGIHIDSLTGGATQTIIGPGPYSAGNGSIAGNNGHNPFIDQTATFTFTGLTGVTSATQITGATFSFGTVAGVDRPGVPGGGPSGNPTPEPGSLFLSLAGAGLIAIGMVRRNAAAKKA